MDSNRTFAIMLKPVGDDCNLNCDYCYYLRNKKCRERMPLSVLEKSISEIMDIHGKNAVVEFAWHGGEPLLVGLDFYKKAMQLQTQYGKGRKVVNTLQTNGILINEEFCQFFAKHDFLIGISIDGTKQLHDSYRKDFAGNGSFDKAINGLSLLKKHGVRFNILATINAENVKYPKEMYTFLREHTDYIQFLPVVEGLPSVPETQDGLRFSEPQGMNSTRYKRKMAPFTVSDKDFGDFLTTIFDMWLIEDYGKKYINVFESVIGNLNNQPAGLCTAEAVCGHSLTIEANGDVYSCDRYVYDDYKLGNILNTPLFEMAENNKEFGLYKCYSLKEECLECSVLKLCFGGCPKDRVLSDNKNYLCNGYKRFYMHFRQSGKKR